MEWATCRAAVATLTIAASDLPQPLRIVCACIAGSLSSELFLQRLVNLHDRKPSIVASIVTMLVGGASFVQAVWLDSVVAMTIACFSTIMLGLCLDRPDCSKEDRDGRFTAWLVSAAILKKEVLDK